MKCPNCLGAMEEYGNAMECIRCRFSTHYGEWAADYF